MNKRKWADFFYELNEDDSFDKNLKTQSFFEENYTLEIPEELLTEAELILLAESRKEKFTEKYSELIKDLYMSTPQYKDARPGLDFPTDYGAPVEVLTNVIYWFRKFI